MSPPGPIEAHADRLLRGGCHCGRVRYEASVPARIELIACDCSMCRRTGFLHLIVPKASFRLVSGADVLTSYRFHTRVAEHLFCSICGIKSFYSPRSHPDGYSLDARSLDCGVDPAWPIRPFEGSAWEQHAAELEAEP